MTPIEPGTIVTVSTKQSVRLDFVVMAHPARVASGQALAGAVPGARLVMDPDPGGQKDAMRTTVTSRRDYAPDATHQLLLQDDVVLGTSFMMGLYAGIDLFPDAALTLYAHSDSPNGALIRLAWLAGAHWVQAIVDQDYLPCQAVCLPTRFVGEFMDFFTPLVGIRHDEDDVMAEFLQTHRIPAYASVPSVVNHGVLNSLIGNDDRSAAVFSDFHAAAAGAPQYLAETSFCPYLSKGVAYAMVQVTDPGSLPAWRRLHWFDAVDRLGLDRGFVKDQFDRAVAGGEHDKLLDGIGRHYALSIWVTVFMTGFVIGTGGVKTFEISPGTGGKAPILDSSYVWGLMAQGGLYGTFLVPHAIQSLEHEVCCLAEEAFAAGKAAG